MHIVTVDDKQKQAKQKGDFYGKDSGSRFDFECSGFTECQDNHMHSTKNFYFSVREDAISRKSIRQYFDR